MPTLIDTPTVIDCAGEPPKQIREFVGLANTGTANVSVARMSSPAGWSEPGQRPEFEEITFVISGELVVEHEGGTLAVTVGQTVVTEPGEWVRYSTPNGAEYVAICIPAFSPDTVHRDDE